VNIIKQAITFLAGNEIRKISSTLSDDEGRSGEGPIQDLIIGCYDRLIGLITWLDDSVGGAHADLKEARADHDRVQMPSAIIIGKVIQSESDQIFKVIGGSVREEEWIV
jgi:hypothetical protein